jgi:hypothetical protein
MVTKLYICGNGHKFESRVRIDSSTNPFCPDCGAITQWYPTLNTNEHAVGYSLRVICDGIAGIQGSKGVLGNK